MKKGKPSSTAHFVALGRAFANEGMSHVAGFTDPTARAFLTKRGQTGFEKAVRSDPNGWRYKSARQMADMIALRSSAIDAAVRKAVEKGAKQLVILGAGYDGRAWRLPELKGVKVFEVDHPATQGDKQRRVKDLPPAMTTVEFVPIDFERESLDSVLDRAGHDRTVPTCWIWEGVVMYLTFGATRTTLDDIGARSASGSTLIVNYHTAHRRFVARLIFRLIGEPQISAFTREEMADELRGVGFRVREDSGMTDWNNEYAKGAARVERAAYMRIVVARV